MLARVAGKNHPRIPLARQPEQLGHLAAANLPGLIHHDDRALSQFTLDQKIGNRRRRRKIRLFHRPRLAGVAARGRPRSGPIAGFVRPVRAGQNFCPCQRRREKVTPYWWNAATRPRALRCSSSSFGFAGYEDSQRVDDNPRRRL